MVSIATPISNLFEKLPESSPILTLSDCFEIRDKTLDSVLPRQYLYHSDFQPIHEASNEEWVYLEKIRERKKELKLVSFHIASSCDDPIFDGMMFQPGGVDYTRAELLSHANKNITRIKSIFGNEVKIAVENNNFYNTYAYNYVTDSDFISELILENQIFFLFDISHAKITAFNKGIDYKSYLGGLPLERMIQIHISNHNISGFAFDAHDCPDEELLKEVRFMIERYSVKYVTPEFYRDQLELENLMKVLQQQYG